jgi:hypothetical protein
MLPVKNKADVGFVGAIDDIEFVKIGKKSTLRNLPTGTTSAKSAYAYKKFIYADSH